MWWRGSFEASLVDQANEVVAQFETSLAGQDKDRIGKAFHRCLWSWTLPIWKRVVWSTKRLVYERRWHRKVEVEDIGFFDQFVESDIEPIEKLEVVAEDIPNLVDVGMDIGFHD